MAAPQSGNPFAENIKFLKDQSAVVSGQVNKLQCSRRRTFEVMRYPLAIPLKKEPIGCGDIIPLQTGRDLKANTLLRGYSRPSILDLWAKTFHFPNC